MNGGSVTTTAAVSWKSASSWLVAYFFFNITLTIYNKLVLAGNFPFPYTLTAIHALSGTIGSWACLQRGVFVLAPLSLQDQLPIILFSVLYTINIIVSNVSLYSTVHCV
jgi:Triose-phosphate Transporter family